MEYASPRQPVTRRNQGPRHTQIDSIRDRRHQQQSLDGLAMTAHVVRPRRSPASFPCLLIFCLLLVFVANASPFTQITFQNPHPTDGITTTKWGDRLPCLDVALQSLSDASFEVLETFESVMSELRDAARELTWTLPEKNVLPRPSKDWDFTVASSALPEHALRVKKPKSLGVDDVKQVYTAPFP